MFRSMVVSRSKSIRFLMGGLLLAIASHAQAQGTNDPDVIRFNRDVRPILSDHCFACHGPDAARREADLRLDTEQGLKGIDGQPGVVTGGSLEASELWRRVALTHDDEQMPPAEFGKDLSAEQLDVLRRWIEQGAQWEGHWAFQPVAGIAPPAVEAADQFVGNEIDLFVLSRLREAGLEPSPVSDRRTLIRRLSLDLTGLPPTPEEVERFVNDSSPEAYERLVDSYLESPHYGERMAMFWLDLVRYADSVGYHGDQEVSISPFRDYVIRSFNENKPFDRFTVEQLAGDLLPNPSTEQLIASGYNRLGMMSAEGGVQPKEYLSKYIAERVRNLGGTWMGVTLGCCECHDHKYDPFSTHDFYSFEAFFADIKEQGLYSGAHQTGNWGPNIPVPSDEQRQQLQQLNREIADVQKALDTETDALAEERAAWIATLPTWLTATPAEMTSEQNVTLTLQDDGSILASGENPANDVYRLSFRDLPEHVTGVRIEVLPHDSLPRRGPGRAGNGNFVLSELVAHVGAADGATEVAPFASAVATYEQTGAAGDNPYGKWAIAAAIDNDEKGPTWGWAVMEQAGSPNAGIFVLAQPIAGGAGSSLVLEMRQNLDNPQHTLGHFRVSFTTAEPTLAGALLPADISAILAVPAADRDEPQVKRLNEYHRSIATSLAPLRERQAALVQQRDGLDRQITRTLVTESVEPRMVRVLNRGNWMDETGEVVTPSLPDFLTDYQLPTDRRPTRLDLAMWLVDDQHPLTSRVFVNRMWKQMFGYGLSRKLDDLGSQGEWPSHPELLDWMSRRFIESGWDVKGLVKLMVMSRTYQQSSISNPRRDELDPFNRWLSRQGRFRVEAEMVRDNAMRISGLLVEELGGPSVRPYQPPGYWAYLNFPAREWQNDAGEKLYRRGVYTHWQRQYLHPSLLAFDAPNREECAADRPRSNTPLQSLVLLNDPIYVEAARVFAENALRQGGATFEERMNWAYLRTVARPPRPEEMSVLRRLFEQHLEIYQADPEAARKLVSVGQYPVPQDLDWSEFAAMTSVTRTLLNLHETITRN
ncbi:MAG: PSD1 and planctomycete cytochrome C domain-containing protein [Pirellulaceae bacterium]